MVHLPSAAALRRLRKIAYQAVDIGRYEFKTDRVEMFGASCFEKGKAA
jgi:hypothetical protein